MLKRGVKAMITIYRVTYQDEKAIHITDFGAKDDAMFYAEGISGNKDIHYIDIEVRESDGGTFETIDTIFIKGNDTGMIEGWNSNITNVHAY
jgi:hypothetical protein